MPDREETTGRFATLEAQGTALDRRFSEHADEDRRRFDKLDSAVERIREALARSDAKLAAVVAASTLVSAAIAHLLFH